jgi:hypothetical protein
MVYPGSRSRNLGEAPNAKLRAEDRDKEDHQAKSLHKSASYESQNRARASKLVQDRPLDVIKAVGMTARLISKQINKPE